MTRLPSGFQFDSKKIDTFFGMVTDRDAHEKKEGEFDLLQNTRHNNLDGLKPRGGTERAFGINDAASGSACLSFYEFTSQNGTTSLFKEILVAGVNTIQRLSAGWVTVFSHAGSNPGGGYWATGGGISTPSTTAATGTTSVADAFSITNTVSTWTVNQWSGYIVVVNGERKLITGNTNNKLFVKDAFDTTPTAGNTFSIFVSEPCAYFGSPAGLFRIPASTFVSTTVYGTSFFGGTVTGVVSYLGRLFVFSGTKVYWSDLGTDNFSRGQWWDSGSNVKGGKPFKNALVIYTSKHTYLMFGDNPTNFSFSILFENVTTSAFRTVSNYYSKYQFFLTNQGTVAAISSDQVSNASNNNTTNDTPVRVSDSYIDTSLATALPTHGEVHRNIYYLSTSGDGGTNTVNFALNVYSSEQARFAVWVWSKDVRHVSCPLGFLYSSTFGLFGCSPTSAQVFNFDVPALTSDLGNPIPIVIEKQRWNPTNNHDRKHYWSFNVIQKKTASSSMVTWEAGNEKNQYISLGTVDLFTNDTELYTVKVTGNPSDAFDVNVGRSIGFKISSTGAVPMGEIEEIQLMYNRSYPY